MDREYLITLYNTLNDISVKGEENLNGLLASIRAVQRLIRIAETPEMSNPAEEHYDKEGE